MSNLKTLTMLGGLHTWEKQNLVTKFDKRGAYDDLKCANCGALARRRGFTEFIETSLNTPNICPKGRQIKTPDKIKIIEVDAQGKAFSNLIPGSEHFVVSPPFGYKNDLNGLWVMGVGEPVKVLKHEYTEIFLADFADLDF